MEGVSWNKIDTFVPTWRVSKMSEKMLRSWKTRTVYEKLEFVIHDNLWYSVLGFVLSRDTDFYRPAIKSNIPKYQIPKSLQTGDWVRGHTVCFFRCSSFDVRLRFPKSYETKFRAISLNHFSRICQPFKFMFQYLWII